MTSQQLLRDMLALFCGLQGVATLALDLNRTHAAHPQWPGHARFHVVWQVTTTVLLALIEIVLLLLPGSIERQRFYLAASLAALPIVAFFIAFAARRLYSGTLHDPKGIAPLKVSFRDSQCTVDLNLVAELLAVLVLAAIVVLFDRASVP